MVIFMNNYFSPQSVNWGSWFSVVKLPSVAFPVAWWPDGIIRAICVHGVVVDWVDEWGCPDGLRFGSVVVPSPFDD